MVYKSYVNGELVTGNDGLRSVVNPGTEEVIAKVSLLDEEQARATLRAAQEGAKYWKSLTLAQREKWISKLQKAIISKKNKIIQLLMEETGKLKSGATEDYQMLEDCLDFYIEEAKSFHGEIIEDFDRTHLNTIVREPLGVVVAYLAWNFPLLNLGYKLGPSLASGCSCIIKPSESTPIATLYIGEILRDINFPKGVVNIVAGDVSKLSHVFNTSKITKMITLIGSTKTGLRVVGDSLTSIKRFSLELGGNAPALVLKDYDPVKAAQTLTEFKFANSGQVCVSPNRVFVHESMVESFIASALDVVKDYKAGWGSDPKADYGPLITPGSRERMVAIVEDAITKGARLISGGKAPEEMEKGYYFEPTILADVTSDMLCYQDEIFGPILPIISYSDDTDLIEAANDTEYGLTSYIFSNDQNEILRLANGIEAGTVCVNKPLYAVELPHGGVKNSGIGKDCSKYSLEEYYYIKRISIALKD